MMSPGQDPVRQAATKEFFRIVSESQDEYELFLSRVTFEELEDAKTEEKRKASADFLQGTSKKFGVIEISSRHFSDFC